MKNRFYPDWESFAYKYRGREQEVLEDLARTLLRKELGIKYGLFQRVNQKGNETDVIEKDGKVIGFQAKFFKNGIDADNIINSMRKAKESNPSQTHYYVYCNQSFGNPRRRHGAKKTDSVPDKTRSEEKIEKVAQSLGLFLVWKLDKAILDEVLTEKWVYDVFFNVNGKLEDLVREEKRHTKIAFNSIGYACPFNGKEIHISRDNLISKLTNQASSTICVIHGDGGCGKTAVLHELFDHLGNDVPICYRKAASLDVKNLSEVFCHGDLYSFTDFKEAYDGCKRKYFIIDSAEHIEEIKDGTIVPTLVKGLLDDQWCVVFTVRNVFVSDLLNSLICQLGEVKIDKEEVPLLTVNELKEISRKYGMQLPKDQILVDRIRNLFYLNLYAQYYIEIDLQTSDSAFTELVWEKKIKGKNNRLGFVRENEFEAFVAERMRSGLFFLPPGDYTSKEFYTLVDDEIITLDTANGFYISHDIFEEWGMYRIVDKQWDATDNVTSFLTNLGDTRAIRRVFRLWLKNSVKENPDKIKEITQAAFSSEMPGLWKDEVLCALLLSDKASIYFDQFENHILNNIDGFADKIIWALRVGCQYLVEVVNYKDYFLPYYAPIGSGWEYIIHLLYSNYDKIDLSKWLPLLFDWTKQYGYGEITRKVGLMMISYYQSEAYERIRYREETVKLVHDIFNNSVMAIKNELSELLYRCMKDDSLSRDLPEFVISRNEGAWCIQRIIPQTVIDLCLHYWRKNEDEEDYDDWDIPYSRSSLNDGNGFGIGENILNFDYFPPGADQTPTAALLKIDEMLAVDFIIRLMNECVDNYAQSEYKDTIVKVIIKDRDGRCNWQWHSETLWEMYRGVGSPIAPYCLMSVHMALERHLLNKSKDGRFADCEKVMQRLLFECHSSSVSAVVASLVLAYPDEYWREALVLFTVIDFFIMDGQRAMTEATIGSLYRLFAGLNRLVDFERMETTKQEFRKHNLENICLNYQFLGSKVLEKEGKETLIQNIYDILDEHRSSLVESNSEKGQIFEILLSRMDRRRLKVRGFEDVEGGVAILFDAELNEEACKMSEDAAIQQQEMFKYIGLHNWAYAKMHGNIPQNKAYEENLNKAICDALTLEAELEKGRAFYISDKDTLTWVCPCLLKFYRNDLSEDQQEWCKRVIEKRMEQFNGVIGVLDGTVACINVLPILIELFPTEKNKYTEWLYKCLLVPGYGNLNTGNYSIGAVQEYCLWEKEPQLMTDLLAKYVNTIGTNSLKPYHLRIIFGLIPDNPDTGTTELAMDFIKKIPEFMAESRESVQGMFQVVDVLAKLLMNTKSLEILTCLPYTQSIVKENHIGEVFLTFLIKEADVCNNPDRFWDIWNSYRPLVPELVHGWGIQQLGIYTLNTVWLDGVTEWHSLRKKDLEFYMYLAEHFEGSVVVFCGMIKILTSIGSKYKTEGMNWIASAIHHYPMMDLTNTAALKDLEIIMLPYVYANKMQIRKTPELQEQVRTILNFMVSKSSVTGYVLRDLLN